MKKELIKRIEALPAKDGKGRPYVDKKMVIGLIQTMDEPKQATLTDIIERIQGMEENLKALWLHKILKELGSDFEQKKFQEGFKLGSWIGRQLINADKIRQKLNKPVIPQFVADWIEECEAKEKTLLNSLLYTPEGVNSWVGNSDNQETFALAWIFGYEVEKEKRYLVRIIGITNYNSYLNYHKGEDKWTIESRVEIDAIRTEHTRKQLEEAGFSWVFDCEGIEIEEVE